MSRRRTITLLAAAVVLSTLQLAPAIAAADRATVVRPGRDQRLRLQSGSGEAALVLTARAPGTSWAVGGSESTVVGVRVDGAVAGELVVTGDGWNEQRVMVGHLDAGRHEVSLHLEADRSPMEAPVEVRDVRLDVASDPASDAAIARRHAPVLFGRALPELGGAAQNATTDAPLLAYHTLAPAATTGHRLLEYTVVFSNEDGGTATDALMARWGRTTDIEWVYRLEIDTHGDRVAGSAVFQGANHATTAFDGPFDGDRPLLQTCTANNNFCVAPVAFDGLMRFSLDTIETLPPGRTREYMMDQHPETYRRMADELAREGKLEPEPSAATPAVSDLRNYLYVEVEHTTDPTQAAAAVGLEVEVRLTDGMTYRSDHGNAMWTIARDGPAATTIELPPGTTAAEVAAVGVRRVPVYGVDPAAPLHVLDIERAFLLDAAYNPAPLSITFRGDVVLGPARPDAQVWPANDDVQVIAHRGASADRPEHTFASWDLARDMGADYIEQDAHLTKDGYLVSIHDDTLDRTARGPTENCTGLVWEKTLAQLLTCDMGSWFDPAYADERIHTLDEIVDRYGVDTRYYIETKSPELQPGMEDALLAFLDRTGLRAAARSRRQVLIQSFSPQSLIFIHRADPALPLVQLSFGGGSAISSTQLDAIATYAVGVGPPASDVDETFVAAAHERCLDVHPYTVDDELRLLELLDAGVDGVFTNRPDVLRWLVDERDAAPPFHCR